MWESVQTVCLSVGQTFGVVALGFIYGKFKGSQTTILTDVTMSVFLPALALTVILDAKLELATAWQIPAGVLTIMAVSFLGGAVCLRFLKIGSQRGLLLALVIVNSANIPFPLLEPNFGPAGMSLGILCYITTNIIVFTLAIAWVSGRFRPDLLLREPAFVATLTALCMKALHLTLPPVLNETAHITAKGAIPVLLIILGQTLSGVRLQHIRLALMGVFLRFILGLAGGVIAVTLFSLQGLSRDIILFYGMLPSAALTVVLARRYNRDADLVATMVFLTTLFAIVILPLTLILIKSGLPSRIWN
ncbi:MAG: AEC family transporter [Candidatus Eisenbacteria bacterium]|uniref:AEC family transporter n=1 Tax=Eiseniibacteriota bacterium TaxID=2212470 RepID=A0A948RZ17_UNCEI|nr:AEC family transporter [Candidatus Eisenbacteria bacterium]MBU1947259.1 AEC family transporter [Candidatus Eisenbacteria bacterium]MBU2693021.1 AEC family transporter [Candidatus Eisenbacteria bacterium]